MKNISLVLNAVLITAVAFLYYKQFSGGTSASAAAATTQQDSPETSSETAAIVSVPNNAPKDVRLVFINADSIFAKYEYAKKTKSGGDMRVANYQKVYQEKVASFQKEYQDYTEKAGAGGYTKEQGLAIEAGLQKKKDDIMTMEQNQSSIMDEVEKSNADVQKNVYDYLARFNKEHGYYCALAYTKSGGGALGVDPGMDVTAQVLAGLNNEYRAKK